MLMHGASQVLARASGPVSMDWSSSCAGGAAVCHHRGADHRAAHQQARRQTGWWRRPSASEGQGGRGVQVVWWSFRFRPEVSQKLQVDASHRQCSEVVHLLAHAAVARAARPRERRSVSVLTAAGRLLRRSAPRSAVISLCAVCTSSPGQWRCLSVQQQQQCRRARPARQCLERQGSRVAADIGRNQQGGQQAGSQRSSPCSRNSAAKSAPAPSLAEPSTPQTSTCRRSVMVAFRMALMAALEELLHPSGIAH